ncbi:MAG: hypothetical protein Q8942_07135 [Bacillota bacterium]|nr:hypothetical protein [Bacillota bacterium]
MSSPNNRFEFGLATENDSKEILGIYESGEFTGGISVLYTRRPDPYRSLMLEGEKVVLPIIRDKERGNICAIGCCVIRKAYINENIKNVGYLTGLKILPEYRRRTPYISEVYKFLHDETREFVDIYYTTILEENITAQKMLEKKRKNMPEYKYQGNYTVYCFATGKKGLFNGVKPKSVFRNPEYLLEKGNTKGLNEFYNENLKSCDFSPSGIDLAGLQSEDIFTLRDKNNDIVAACAVWNQQSYKQYIITGYNGIFKYISKFPTRWLGYPSFPKEKTSANYACIALFCSKVDDYGLLEEFIRKVAQESSKFDFIMYGLFENNPMNVVLQKIKHVKYRSKVYLVDWEEPVINIGSRPINLEVGLL